MHNEGNYKQDEKTAFRMGENKNKATVKELISKIYKQLMQAQYQKNKGPKKKKKKNGLKN